MNTFAKVYSFSENRSHYMRKAVLLLTMSAVLSIVPYYVVYQIIQHLTAGEKSISFYIFSGCIIFAALLLKNIFNEYGLKSSHRLAYDTLAGMRKHASEKLLHMPMGNIQTYGSGDLKLIFVENIEAMELVLAHGIPEGIGNILGIIVTMSAMFIADWRMALCTLAVLPIGMAVIMIMGKNATTKLSQYYNSLQGMNNSIVEYIRGMEVIKVFTQGDTSFAKYQNSIHEYKKFSLQWYKSCWKYMAVYGVILPATWLFVLPAGMFLFVSGGLNLSMLILCLLFALAVGPMFMRLVTFIPIIPGLTEKFKRIEVLYDEPEMESSGFNKKPSSHSVSFENVTFAYKEKDVLCSMSFEAAEGCVTALVGESGAGKSTIGKLIARFWDVKDGSIKLGGRDIREYSFHTLMETVSYVAQDNFLFDTSIMENIRNGSPKASDSEVVGMAKRANCHEFIEALPNGYQTIVGESGDRLSGGQRQRITIARAMLKNAPVVILDEATSSTDAENEDLIQAALNELLVGKTVIVIAHRLSTIIHANNIIVLRNGKIEAQGSHNSLIENSPAYLHMWNRYESSIGWNYQTQGEEA